MRTPRGLLRALLPVFALSAAAQTYTAKSIVFSEPGDYTQAQLEDAAGLHAGSSFKTADLAAAAQRLVDTGLFDEAGATLDGKLTAATVKFSTKPIPRSRLIPVGFENFVWLSRDEIDAAIRTRFPLYSGYLPDNSPHQAEIKAALIAALAAKSITAKVGFETYEPTMYHPRREIGFRITDPPIRVTNVKLAGVTTALVPLIQKSVNSTAHTLYTEGPADQTTADRILAPLLNAGYLQAALTYPAISLLTEPDGSIGTVFAAKLAPGEIFHVTAISFTGSPLLSADNFASTSKLHPGDLASRVALLQTIEPLDAAYRRQGYMDVVVMAAPTLDEAAHTVAYAVSVTPGEQYRIHEVTANNLDPAAKADFDRGWLMKPGELYNPGYVSTFLKNNTALRALAGYSAGFRAYAMPDTHTVDLVITFIKGTAR